MDVIKRDGLKRQKFDLSKIILAITKANEAVIAKGKKGISKSDIKNLAEKVFDEIKDKDVIGIEKIQDLVEKTLMDSGNYDIAKSYILYREERSRARFLAEPAITTFKTKLDGQRNDRQNANIDELSYGGREGEAESELSKYMALEYYVSPKVAKLHKNNEVYLHDLNSLAVGKPNCLSIPIDDLLEYGFNTRQTDIRPANSISSALQIAAVTFQLQSLQQFGGVSFTHIDWTLVPYFRLSFYKHYSNIEKILGKKHLNLTKKQVRNTSIEDSIYRKGFTRNKIYKEALELTIKELNQAVEGMYHNLNTLQSRSGNQLPFTSINYGTCTLPEGRLIIKSILEKSIEGVGKMRKTSIFPCGIFQVKEGINLNKGDPNYDLFLLAAKSTAARLYPNYANCDWVNQTSQVEADRKVKEEALKDYESNPVKYEQLKNLLKNDKEIADKLWLEVYDEKIVSKKGQSPLEIFSTMGCRTANGFDANFTPDYYKDLLDEVVDSGKLPRNYLFFGDQKDGRGNITPATVILPTLAMEAFKKGKSEEERITIFFDILNKKIKNCIDGLEERFNWIAKQSPEAAKFTYENNTMKGYIKEDGIISALKHGTLAVGQIGIAETLQILIGKNHTTDEGMKLAKRIEETFLNACNEAKEKKHKPNLTASQIAKKMIELRGDKITEEEIKQIEEYCNGSEIC